MGSVGGNADGEGVAGDAPGDVVGEGGVGGAAGADGVGAAGEGLVAGLVARWRLLRCFGGEGVVEDGSGRVPVPPLVGAWCVEVVCWFTGFGGAGCLWCQRSLLVTLMVGVVLVMVLLMPLAWVV